MEEIIKLHLTDYAVGVNEGGGLIVSEPMINLSCRSSSHHRREWSAAYKPSSEELC
jgi:hypothetical protein